MMILFYDPVFQIASSLITPLHFIRDRREDGRDREGDDVLAMDSLNASNLGYAQVNRSRDWWKRSIRKGEKEAEMKGGG